MSSCIYHIAGKFDVTGTFLAINSIENAVNLIKGSNRIIEDCACHGDLVVDIFLRKKIAYLVMQKWIFPRTIQSEGEVWCGM